MGRHIIKLSKGKKDFYLEWSTITDMPVTPGMYLEEFKEYYEKKYGSEKIQQLAGFLKRAEETGCGTSGINLDDLLASNKAGDDDTKISKEEIIKKYCF